MGEVLLSRQTFTCGCGRAKLTGSLMETRAPYALIGFFVLAVVAGVFGFIYWLHNTGGLSERTVYRVRFENTVSGLLVGAPVLFNGIRVGEVAGLDLDPGNPRQVTAMIAVASTTPVRTDTQAGLEYQGLTGVPVVSLLGGTSAARLPSPSPTEPPILVADPAAGQSMTEAARQALRRIDSVLADSSDPLKSAIANLNTFTAALARNSDRVDTILSGLERATGSAKATVPKYFDLTPPRTFPPSDKTAKSQLVVLEPTVVVALDTQRIIVEVGDNAGTPDNAQWSDTIPKLLQARIVQSFENSNYLGAVARPIEGLTADYQLQKFWPTGVSSARGHSMRWFRPPPSTRLRPRLLSTRHSPRRSQTWSCGLPASFRQRSRKYDWPRWSGGGTEAGWPSIGLSPRAGIALM